MAYIGNVIPIPQGQAGLHTDDAPSAIPPNALIRATNVSIQTNLIEKMAGSIRFNTDVIPSGVYGAFDFWPDANIAHRRLIVLGGDGKVCAIANAGTVTEIAASGGAPATLSVTNQVFFVAGGFENASNSRKLFIFNGVNPVQVITGTAVVRTDLSAPPADWTGTHQPSFGFIFRSHLFGGGVDNNPHQMYASATNDHEDFTTTPLLYPVDTGQGERLLSAIIFKGRPFVFKYPTGAYYLDDSDTSSANWFFRIFSPSFGAASAHSPVQVLNDVLVKNASDAITSMDATLAFGDIVAGDVFSTLKIEQFVRDQVATAGAPSSHALYYPEKRTAFFTYRSTLGTSNDRMLMFRVDVQGLPKATFVTKDAPNCLALRKDTTLIERPIYGSLDGYVYLLDQENRNVNGAAYVGDFQTPDLDFGFVDPKLAARVKIFDFVELRYVPQGDWNLYGDVYIDGNFTETLTFPMTGGELLADTAVASTDFMLSDDANPQGSFLSGEDLLTQRVRVRGSGRTIGIKFYNSGLNQTFKVAMVTFSFRASGEQQKG